MVLGSLVPDLVSSHSENKRRTPGRKTRALVHCCPWLEHHVPDQKREASSRIPPTCVRRMGLDSSLSVHRAEGHKDGIGRDGHKY